MGSHRNAALADPKDRRWRAVALTEHGREVTVAVIKMAAGIIAATLTPLAPDEQARAVKLFKEAGLSPASGRGRNDRAVLREGQPYTRKTGNFLRRSRSMMSRPT